MNVRDSISNIPPADTWTPQVEDVIFSNAKGIVAAPVSKTLGVVDENGLLDYFIMSTKKCYNSQVMRDHICLYLNYFEKFYDPDHELQIIMYRIKYMIDTTPLYSVDNFMYDIRAYILSNGLKQKVQKMVEDNYSLDLQYKNIPENLQYKNEHAMTMLAMSIFMNFVIPLITHFGNANKIDGIDEFILFVFDPILNMYPGIDIYSKIYETAYSNVSKSETKNAPIWAKQDIRGKDSVTHSYDSVTNIILNIMPKYVFNQSIISLNFTSILKSTSCQILDIEYEYNYIPLSSSKRDESESSSEFDKFESNLIRQNESLLIQNSVNSAETTRYIDITFGPFDQWEIDFYKERLKNSKGVIINNFQKLLIFNLFYKMYGDTQSIYAINSDDYIKLMLSAKRILLDSKMLILPYIISSKCTKLVTRKTVNKKEKMRLEASRYYDMVMNKYRNEKIIMNILSMIATIISSDFTIIDYYNRDIDGKKIDTSPDIIIEEVLTYVLLI